MITLITIFIILGIIGILELNEITNINTMVKNPIIKEGFFILTNGCLALLIVMFLVLMLCLMFKYLP
jgi:hypothetical protein